MWWTNCQAAREMPRSLPHKRKIPSCDAHDLQFVIHATRVHLRHSTWPTQFWFAHHHAKFRKVHWKHSVYTTKYRKVHQFQFWEFAFIDSFQFLSASLDSLVENLKTDSENLEYNFRHFFSDFTNKDEAHLLLQKNAFPYDYLDSEERFEETQLPPIEYFYSSIKNEGIHPEEYERAQYVYDRLKLRNLGEWADIYLKTDVLLLCSIFENFRDVTLREFQLDPAHFYSAPGQLVCYA